MNDPRCIGCNQRLCDIDRDPDGYLGTSCAQCVAESEHDFTAEPFARFSWTGRRLVEQRVRDDSKWRDLVGKHSLHTTKQGRYCFAHEGGWAHFIDDAHLYNTVISGDFEVRFLRVDYRTPLPREFMEED